MTQGEGKSVLNINFRNSFIILILLMPNFVHVLWNSIYAFVICFNMTCWIINNVSLCVSTNSSSHDYSCFALPHVCIDMLDVRLEDTFGIGVKTPVIGCLSMMDVDVVYHHFSIREILRHYSFKERVDLDPTR